MSKYASLLFSPEKYHEIGPFRFPIYKDLVPGEARGIETISRKQSKTTFASLKLAQRIAKDRGISTKEAVELLSSNAEDNQEFFYDYATEIEELQSNTVGAVEQQIAYVTLFMQYRGEVKLPRSRDWQKLTDWSEADTEAMPAKYMEEIFRLIGWERDGWPEPEGKSEVVEVTVTNLPPTNS
jgi:hypothetical protein